MCIILYCKSRKPTKEEILLSYLRNNDGIGIGFYQNSILKSIKGINIKILNKIIDNINLPFVIHFRFTSSGETNKQLCHPFIINENSELELITKNKNLFFHNGTVNISGINKNQKEWSDSRFLSITAYKNKILFGNYSFLEKIFSKFVIMEQNNVLLYGKFIEDSGIYFSNDQYKPFSFTETFYYQQKFFNKLFFTKNQKQIFNI